jgi:hypothetical protein
MAFRFLRAKTVGLGGCSSRGHRPPESASARTPAPPRVTAAVALPMMRPLVAHPRSRSRSPWRHWRHRLGLHRARARRLRLGRASMAIGRGLHKEVIDALRCDGVDLASSGCSYGRACAVLLRSRSMTGEGEAGCVLAWSRRRRWLAFHRQAGVQRTMKAAQGVNTTGCSVSLDPDRVAAPCRQHAVHPRRGLGAALKPLGRHRDDALTVAQRAIAALAQQNARGGKRWQVGGGDELSAIETPIAGNAPATKGRGDGKEDRTPLAPR